MIKSLFGGGGGASRKNAKGGDDGVVEKKEPLIERVPGAASSPNTAEEDQNSITTRGTNRSNNSQRRTPSLQNRRQSSNLKHEASSMIEIVSLDSKTAAASGDTSNKPALLQLMRQILPVTVQREYHTHSSNSQCRLDRQRILQHTHSSNSQCRLKRQRILQQHPKAALLLQIILSVPRRNCKPV